MVRLAILALAILLGPPTSRAGEPKDVPAAAAPAVYVAVERKERAKVIGLGEQLHLWPVKPGNPITSDDWKVVFRWKEAAAADPPHNAKDGETIKVNPWPSVSTDPTSADLVRRLILSAVAGSFGPEPDEGWMLATADSPAHCVTIEFPSPRTGVSKARQFRVARRFIDLLLRDLGALPGDEKTFSAASFPGRVVGNYDAEGVGYGGSTLLDRAVDETSLAVRILPLCPEDIREDGLQGAVGVLFPGGSGRAIADALQPEGVAKVRDFVSSGGGYYGVCAGAYFANSGRPEYAGLMHLKHHQPWRKGKGMLKVKLTAEGKQLLGEEFSEFDTRYNCGPVFTEVGALPPESLCQPVTVLANFASSVTDAQGGAHEEMVGTPAILYGQWGRGHVVTVSPHPESHPQLAVLVARAIGLSLGEDTRAIVSAAPTEKAGD